MAKRAIFEGVAELQKISYDEAREWFWIRTAVWFVPTYIVTAIGFFAYAGAMIQTFGTRMTVSLLSALAATLLGLLSAVVSMQYPWMRLGRWKLWWLNSLISAVISAALAVGLCAVILTIMRGNPQHFPSSYVLDTTDSMMGLSIAASAAWGAIFGAWFALRLDKYFVESI